MCGALKSLLCLILLQQVLAANAPEQIHVQLGHTPSEVVISWITPTNVSAPSTVMYGTSSGALTLSATGITTQYQQHCTGFNTPTYNYTSGIIHHTLVSGLLPSTKYFYRVGGPSQQSTERNFTTMPPVGPSSEPFTFAVLGDLGQTNYSQITVNHMLNDPSIQVILHAGDFAYADCDQNRWDSWGRMVDPLASTRPWMVVPGNHEIETDLLFNRTFEAYKSRFVMPEYRPTNDTTKSSQLVDFCTPSVYTGNYNYGNSFYSVNIGPMHYIGLNSYTETNVSSAQYQFLLQDLAAVNRALTPWIVIVVHSPWYNSNFCHYLENNTVAMKASMEDLYFKYGVDIVVSGHVHAYERSYPVYKNVPTPGAPTYIVIGDGGNREGHCPDYYPRPIWSAFRNGSYFGHGRVTLANSSHAYFQWFRNADPEFVEADSVWIVNSRATEFLKPVPLPPRGVHKARID